ncbi:MAG TPA: cupin domain-containing protein [Steroidobacteraceae bacterium]|nr:cupin domain-containing protein [Steroidobacteraceae bacterium]
MEKPSLNIVRAADIAAHAQEFSHPWNPASLMRGTQLGRSVGLKRTGVNFIRVPTGRESYVYHSHRFEEEWLYILSGTGVALIDGQEFAVAAGDFIGFPTPSVAHLLRNTGAEDLVYLSGGENREFEVAEFPTLKRRMVRMGEQVDVYDADDARAFGPI